MSGRARDRAADAVRRMITDGTLRPGDPVPSIRELSAAMAIGLDSCKAALLQLVEDGVLVQGPRGSRSRRRVAGAAPARDVPLAAALAGLRDRCALTPEQRGRNGGVPPEARGLQGFDQWPYQQIAAVIEDVITSGALPPGAPILSEKEMRALTGVSRWVVRHAVTHLRGRGLIDTVPHVGSFVAPAPSRSGQRM